MYTDIASNLNIVYADKELERSSVEKKIKNYLGVYHGIVRIYARRINLDRIKYVAKIARSKQVRILLLPPYFNTGPIIEFYGASLKKRKYLTRLFEKTSDSSIRALKSIALSERMDVLVTSFLEKAGAHYYVSSILILKNGSLGGKYRKISLTKEENLYNVHSGKNVVVFNTSRMNYGILINNEIKIPEFCRCLRALGANIIIVSLNPLDFKYKNIFLIGKVRAIENNVPVLFVGGIVEYHDKVVSAAPTVLINSEGEPVFEYNENKPALILFDMDNLGVPQLDSFDILVMYQINRIVFNELRRLQLKIREKLYSQSRLEEF